MLKRTLGNTGIDLTVVGFGGIIVMNETAEVASREVGQAIERGINYFDIAPSYGNAQQVLGPALEPYRKDIFLACKTGERTAAGAQAELAKSLSDLRTDHLDLYQFHAVTTMEDVETILGPGGAMEVFEQALKDGVVRNIGFSAHGEEAAIALMNRHELASVLFPFNWVTWLQEDFGPSVNARAAELGMGRLALKTLAKRAWGENEERTWPKCWYSPVDSFEEAELAMRFTLSQGITACTSPSHEEFLWWMCDIAESLTPITEEEVALLQASGKGLQAIFPQ